MLHISAGVKFRQSSCSMIIEHMRRKQLRQEARIISGQSRSCARQQTHRILRMCVCYYVGNAFDVQDCSVTLQATSHPTTLSLSKSRKLFSSLKLLTSLCSKMPTLQVVPALLHSSPRGVELLAHSVPLLPQCEAV